ncbi:MAG: LysE family translocator, partial [Albidovulum sp.]|uniref:LysE family translocator n=1 Tax=Albidovulum sp. TaxID=1872424 RepID=UPI003CAEE464
MPLELWLTFVAASTALLLIPGPTVLLVLTYALTQGRRVAAATAAGVAFGDLVAMTASLLGVGALVMASATLFTILKWAGALYLIWLGIGLLRTRPAEGFDLSGATDLPVRDIFGHAAAVTALNPKSIAFFIAFVPQFLRPDAALAPQFAILIATFVALAAANALAYALLADRMRARMTGAGTRAGLNRIGGTALIGMGVMTAALR